MFLWETNYCFRVMGQLLVEAHPWMEPYVKIPCEKDHRCHFQGWEDPTDQCQYEWGTWENRIFKPDDSLRI
jgi:hypothetical protein